MPFCPAPSGPATILFLLAGSFLIGEGADAFVHPRCLPRRAGALPLRVLPALWLCSFWLVLTGSLPCALFMGALLYVVVVTASNLKLRLLNEPLVFSDFALLGFFFKHPRFYLQAVPLLARVLCSVGLVLFVALVMELSSWSLSARLIGLGGLVLASAGIGLLVARQSRPEGPAPALWADVRRDGLLPVLLVYAARCWRLPPLPEQPALPRGTDAPESVMVIQCESYADPAALNRAWETLPALQQARQEALYQGRLLPSGLGAYTMRSEYGVLCGGTDEVLSYRQFDPFLSAPQAPSHALPRRLQAFYPKALFLHPYDLRFYGRDRLLPLWGFTESAGQEPFSGADRVGPYVGDAALTRHLLGYMRQNRDFLAYCVTIENHGPWQKGRLGQAEGAGAWHEHVRHGDAMLGDVLAGIKESGRDVMLVFFGDHRPALHGLPPVEGLERSTPYVILRPNGPQGRNGSSNRPDPESLGDLTPAGLHDAILRIVAGRA